MDILKISNFMLLKMNNLKSSSQMSVLTLFFYISLPMFRVSVNDKELGDVV